MSGERGAGSGERDAPSMNDLSPEFIAPRFLLPASLSAVSYLCAPMESLKSLQDRVLKLRGYL